MTTPGPRPPGERQPDHRAAQRLLDDLRTEIGRADSKAAVLMSALGLTTSGYAGLLVGRGWSPWQLSTPAQVLCCMGLAALAGTLHALLLAVLPRYGATVWQPGMPLTHFADIERACALGVLARALPAAELDPTPALLSALAETSRIAGRKHLWIRTGLLDGETPESGGVGSALPGTYTYPADASDSRLYGAVRRNSGGRRECGRRLRSRSRLRRGGIGRGHRSRSARIFRGIRPVFGVGGPCSARTGSRIPPRHRGGGFGWLSHERCPFGCTGCTGCTGWRFVRRMEWPVIR